MAEVDDDEVEPAVGGDRGDREWFEGTGELRRDIDVSLSKTYVTHGARVVDSGQATQVVFTAIERSTIPKEFNRGDRRRNGSVYAFLQDVQDIPYDSAASSSSPSAMRTHYQHPW